MCHRYYKTCRCKNRSLHHAIRQESLFPQTMMYRRALLTSTLFLWLLVCHANAGGHKQVWDHREVLDSKGKYELYWTAEKNVVTFQAEVKAQGWVGFGVSPEGELQDSDIIIGGIKDGKKYFQGYHVEKGGKITPNTKSFSKVSVSETKGRTVLSFTMKFSTCNPETWVIPGDSQHIFFAYSDDDLPSLEKFRLNEKMWQHTMVKLFQPRINEVKMPADVKYFDFRIDNFTLPGNRDTFYACKVIKGPQLKKKHHIIKVASVVRPGNMEMAHHFFLVKCYNRSPEEGDMMVSAGTQECNFQSSTTSTESCNANVAAWGLGGGPYLFPTKAGLPIGEDPNEYYMLQVHYDNPTFANGIVDDSGLRVYYTPILRKHDAGVLAVGFPLVSRIIIPPRQKEFVLAAHAHPRCLSQNTAEEIRIFSVFLHAHQAAMEIKLRHFRNNKELQTIANDMHYMHHHQMYTYLEKDTIVLPEDQLTLECTFRSTDKNVTTFGGEGTSDEMCLSILYYYPRISLTRQASNINMALIAGLTGMDITSGNSQPNTGNGFDDAAIRYLTNYDWTKQYMCTVQNSLRYSPQDAYCVTNDTRRTPVPSITYPEVFKPFMMRSPCPKSGKNKMQERCPTGRSM